MRSADNARAALFALNAFHKHQGGQTFTADTVTAEVIADAIADLLHLADIAADCDARTMHARALRTYNGDRTEADDGHEAPLHTVYHGTPAELTPGTVLLPGEAYAHVFCTDNDASALSWAEKKANVTGGRARVYRVQLGADGWCSRDGEFTATSALILEEVDVDMYRD